jgi:hypothetical protein
VKELRDYSCQKAYESVQRIPIRISNSAAAIREIAYFSSDLLPARLRN